MKNKVIIWVFIVVLLSSCARWRQGCARNVQNTKRDYIVVMFSGGDTVFVDKFHGIINNEDSSDGIFYFKGDTLVELSGDYIIISEK